MHDTYCNCEDCWWSRGCAEVCATCGCLVGSGCSCSSGEEEDEENQVGTNKGNDNNERNF